MTEQTIESYLESLGVKIEWKFQGIKRYFPGDLDKRLVWQFTLTRGTRSYTSTFGDSVHETLCAVISKGSIRVVADREEFNRKVEVINRDTDNPEKIKAFNITPPELSDLMSCLEWETPEDFSDWCYMFGYSDDSIKAMKQWESCLEQSRGLAALFSDEEFDQIQSLLADY